MEHVEIEIDTFGQPIEGISLEVLLEVLNITTQN